MTGLIQRDVDYSNNSSLPEYAFGYREFYNCNFSGLDMTARAFLVGVKFQNCNFSGCQINQNTLPCNFIMVDCDTRNMVFKGKFSQYPISSDGVLIREIAEHVLFRKARFAMDDWHTTYDGAENLTVETDELITHCETYHCLSGWAQIFTKGGLELAASEGNWSAGLILLGLEPAQHFMSSTYQARQYLREIVK